MLDPFDELDRVVDQVRVEVLDLILRELHVVEARNDVVVREEPLLETLLDETVELLDLRESDIDGQHEPAFSSRARTDTDLHLHRAGSPRRRRLSDHQARES